MSTSSGLRLHMTLPEAPPSPEPPGTPGKPREAKRHDWPRGCLPVSPLPSRFSFAFQPQGGLPASHPPSKPRPAPQRNPTTLPDNKVPFAVYRPGRAHNPPGDPMEPQTAWQSSRLINAFLPGP